MVSEKEKIGIRRFVKGQLRNKPDLSTLTLGILKKQYLAQAGCESLSSEERKFMKQVVEEELAKMQGKNDSESEPEINKPQKKRKREKEELESDDETKSRAKKSRQSGSSDSEDEQNCETGSPSEEKVRSQSKHKEEATKESDNGKNKKAKCRITSDSSSDEEMNESEKVRNESPSPEEGVKKKVNTAKNGETSGVDTSEGETNQSSDKESESDADNKSEKSDKINDSDSSAIEKEEHVKNGNDSDLDSSLLPSLNEEKKSSPKKIKEVKKKKKTKKTNEKNRGPKDENKAVVRLKRYIALCGVRRNYKKLLDGCRSTHSKVAVLKKELEDLGVRGNPSIEKCKKIRLKREEAQELAELDVDNIITTEGRPKRRGTSAVKVQTDPRPYQQALNSDSDSDQEKDAQKGRRKISVWANLRGIISDDADTD